MTSQRTATWDLESTAAGDRRATPHRPRATADPDLVVLGGGAAGLGAARAARAAGASVLLVERGRIGGDCTFTGCVPSKTLLEAAARGASFAEARASVDATVERIAATETPRALEAEGIGVLHGEARFAGPGSLLVDGRPIRAPRVVLATGARPALPPVDGLSTVPLLTTDTVFSLTERPVSLAVLGGGPVGVELAQAFARLGSEVTVVEMADRLLPREEPLASRVVSGVLRHAGIVVRTGVAVVRAERAASGGAVLHLADGTTVTAARVLAAVGRRPATEGLDLEAAGIEQDAQGFVRVDDRLRTSARGAYAAGDVAERLQFTHVAHQTGRLAARNALARVPWHRFRSESMPWVTFCDPEVGRVGITEAQAPAGARVAFLPLSEVDRAVIAGRTEGFVKLVAGPRPVLGSLAGGRLLGATIVAPRAGEMLHEVVLALRSGMFPARLALATHAYPTWSTAIWQAAAQFFGTFGGRSARPADPARPEGSDAPWSGFPT